MRIDLDYNKFIINDIIDHYGGDQDWYKTYFKRLAGCGPTTASNIVMYEEKKLGVKDDFSKEEFIKLMNDLWNYITPGMMGVNKARTYIDGFSKYNDRYKLGLINYKNLHIGKYDDLDKDYIFEFLKEAIEKDHPVAFLNLDSGKEKNLESWHWTTIIGISNENNNLKAVICDNTTVKDIDLGLWLSTTSSEADFIYFYE